VVSTQSTTRYSEGFFFFFFFFGVMVNVLNTSISQLMALFSASCLLLAIANCICFLIALPT
jgi:hypothetical protein